MFVNVGDRAGRRSRSATVMLADITTIGSQSSVTVSSIPGTYRDLRVVISGRGTKAATFTTLRLQLNGDSGANYDGIEGDLNSAGLGPVQTLAGTSITLGYLAAASSPANVSDSAELTIFNYSGTVFQKASIARSTLKIANTSANLFNVVSSWWWRNTAAITSFTITPDSNAFVDGTNVAVYATGGSACALTT